MNTFILRQFYKLIGKNPADMPMVQYWKTKDSVEAKITESEDGTMVMYMEGEKYPFPTYPRGRLLFGSLSKLKHEIKNQVFNENWWKLEAGESQENIVKNIKHKLFNEITELAELSRYDMLPYEKMTRSVKEIHRAWTKIAPTSTYNLRDYLCFILQEDDAYRFRVQWLVKYFNPNSLLWRWFDPIKLFEKGLTMIEHAEVVGDMKERIRLLRRILLVCLGDKIIKDLFIKLIREIDWKKLKLTKADAFHFRGKYFKVDMDILEY